MNARGFFASNCAQALVGSPASTPSAVASSPGITASSPAAIASSPEAIAIIGSQQSFQGSSQSRQGSSQLPGITAAASETPRAGTSPRLGSGPLRPPASPVLAPVLQVDDVETTFNSKRPAPAPSLKRPAPAPSLKRPAPVAGTATARPPGPPAGPGDPVVAPAS